MVGLSDEGGGGGELNPYLRIKQINGMKFAQECRIVIEVKTLK